MKTIVKINPEIEYNSAKEIIAAIGESGKIKENISDLDSAVDNMKTVINVLIERATPKKRTKPAKKTRKNKKKKRSDFDKLPSEKFPDLNVTEEVSRPLEAPLCSCCNQKMTETGLYKTSEKLEVIPKQYHIVRNKRVIYGCRSCHGSMVNSPPNPSISPCSNYGDSIVIDAALSKYCDLIPMERYCAMAERQGLAGIPANSLIGLTHNLAEFFQSIYAAIGAEVKSAKVVLGDETPHRMLEGDDTSNWYLWGFACNKGCIFEAHGSRSGDIPLEFLSESQADYFVADGYSGYKKALRKLTEGSKEITEVFCNAHAYRYFRDASTTWESECEPYLQIYGEIYELERKADDNETTVAARLKMLPLFESIRHRCTLDVESAMPGSGFLKAINYFLNHFDGLTRCVQDVDIPLDNNFSERLLRSAVIGRKTWYGTHSKRGARTNAVLFSIVETCKINSINPRNYFQLAVDRLHAKEKVITPSEYAVSIDSG